MIELNFVRCSVDSLTEPAAEPRPVVVEPFCSVVLWLDFDAAPFFSDLPLDASDLSLSIGCFVALAGCLAVGRGLAGCLQRFSLACLY